MFIGIDAVHDGLIGYSHRIGSKPRKGGLPNILYVLGSVEALPLELAGFADRVTVLFPWGSLLRIVALADIAGLGNIRALCQSDASLEVVLAYHEDLEPTEVMRLGLPPLSEPYLRDLLARRYREAGFRLTEARQILQPELRSLPSTWARRLAHGRTRPVWRITAQASPSLSAR